MSQPNTCSSFTSALVIVLGLLFSGVALAENDTQAERPDLSHLTDGIAQQGKNAVQTIRDDNTRTSYEWNYQARELLANVWIEQCIARLVQ